MKRKHIILLAVVIVVLAASAILGGWFRKEDSLQGSGTVEARNIRVGSEIRRPH